MLLALILACVNLDDAEAAASGLTWIDVPDRAAPMSLTAADGTGLKLAEMHVEAVIESPLAFTELHLVFENPEDRQIEGRFEITLPTGAAVSRFAMKLGEDWQEGEVVELQAARRAYEDFLHRRTDPALLEYDAGNEFRARVFPIEPHSKKEIIISWSHDLDVNEAWSLPTAGLPELGLLVADVYVGGEHYEMQSEYAVPEGDLSLSPRSRARMALRGERTSVIRLQPELSVSKDGVSNATVLVDTSASRALSFDALIADLLATVPTFKGDVKILAYDQEVVEIYDGPVRSLTASHLETLRERGAMGASDLEAALKKVGDTDRLVVFTDGVLTAGSQERAALATIVQEERIGRVDAVIRGGARDEALLRGWVSSGEREGVVLDADAMPIAEVARRLGLGTAGEMEIEVPGAEWVYPHRVSGLQPGDTLTVYADLPRSEALDLKLDGRSVGSIPSTDSNGPLLKRASAQAEIGALLEEKSHADGAEEREAIIAEIVEVSTRNRVLSPHTALLVLETAADYERFDIPRNALTDVLVVEDGKLDWMKRSEAVLGEGASVEAPEDEEKTASPKQDMESNKKAEAAEAAMEVRSGGAASEMDVAREMEAAPQRPQARLRASPARSSRGRARRERRGDVAPAMSIDLDEAEMRVEGDVPPTPPGMPQTGEDPLAGWEGDYREVKALLLAKKSEAAESFALSWRERSPGDPLALLALGEVWEAMGRPGEAARAYGSLIDLFPSRADLRRLAGERLETLGPPGMELAVDTFRVAVSQRGDHPSGHRLLAWSLVKQGEHEAAIKVLRDALGKSFDRFEAAHRILREDAALIAAAWKAKDKNAPLEKALKGLDVVPSTQADLRFVLNWETDANDVDFHIYDAQGGHAYYSDRELSTGGILYADITTGYGPECFTIPDPEAFPYTLQAHYYSRGPMGFGMGKLQIIEHDGHGGLAIEERPFVVMTDGAFVPLGTVEGSAF